MENHITTEKEMRQICTWHYEGRYGIYDLPPFEIMRKNQMGFCKPDAAKNYRVFCENGEILGFVNLQEEQTEVFVGIGVKPELCGRGYGSQILTDACRIAGTLYPGKPLYLQVRTWNQRAVNCYKKAGFRIDGKPYTMVTGIGEGRFYRMVKE